MQMYALKTGISVQSVQSVNVAKRKGNQFTQFYGIYKILESQLPMTALWPSDMETLSVRVKLWPTTKTQK